MFDFVGKLFDTSDWPPRWECGSWTTGHGNLHIISDIAVFSAYMAIPILIIVIGYNHRRMLAHPLAWLFVCFILFCGLTHLIEATLFYRPWYRFAGVMKALTAIVSWATVVAMIRIVPKGLALPEENRQLTLIRNELEKRVEERTFELQQANQQLEQRVQERTQQLAESEAWYRTLTESLPQLVWTADVKGDCEYLSSQWEQYTGLTEEEQSKRGWLEPVYPSDREQFEIAWQQVIQSGMTLEAEIRIRDALGSYRWHTVRAAPLRNEEGKVTKWFGTCTDIDDNKRLEVELTASEERLRRAISNLPVPMIIHDENDHILEMSQGWTRFSGYTRKDLSTFADWTEKAFGERVAFLKSSIDQLFEKRRTQEQGESMIRTKGGGQRIWEFSTTPLGLSAKGDRLLLTLGIDITQRKRYEEELRQSEELSRAMVEQASIGIARVAPDGQFLLVNDALCKIVGYTEEELMELTFQDITHPDDLKADLNHVQKLLSGVSNHYTMDKRYFKKNGSIVWIHLSVSLVRDRSGKPLYFISIIQDIHERVEARRFLDQVNQELEERVRERTGELESINHNLHEQVHENEMFVYSVSHDLRSPLVNLQGFSKELSLSAEDLERLLAEESIPLKLRERARQILHEEFKESLHFIDAGVRRLSHIIDALLNLSRVGRVEYEWRFVDLNVLIQGVLDSVKMTSEEKNVTIHVELLPDVWGDVSALEQLFSNLIGNAMKYLDPQREGRIEISSVPCQDTGFGTIAIKDNGLGIAVESQEAIFRAFYRAHPDVAEGEGLGLALVRRIVDRHRGKIHLQSTPGEGATFYVTLPVEELKSFFSLGKYRGKELPPVSSH